MGSSWLRRLSSSAPESGSHTLICFPHAGGSVLSFGPLARRVGAGFDILAVQYPGRQDRRDEPLVGNIQELVDELMPALMEELGAVGDFSLFGHSMGSVVAFEVCRRLERESGLMPSVLFASGRRAPSAPQAGGVHLLNDQDLCDQLVRFGGTPTALLADPEFRATILSVVRNDYRAIETYECAPGAVIECPVVALTGDRDPDASLADIEGWRGHTSGSFFATSFPGGHFFIDANCGPIAQLIREHSSQAVSR
ncbi:thioesterase II family protein [Nocardia sp. NPDC020380]|uniref:thioesterase II family protein n=1 Tax=Nocardia sp. NPDC020380 TaxID=3364309 RepID=UPI00378EAD7D